MNRLSNHHQKPFMFREIEAKSVENHWFYHKAMAHGQSDLALECLTAQTPAMAKTYGQGIRCAKDWDSGVFAKNLMAAIQLARFEQVDSFSEALEEAHSKGTYLIETVPKNGYSVWSSGLDRESTLHTDPDYWPGDNGMGQILNQLMVDKFGPIQCSHIPHPKVYKPKDLPFDSSDSGSDLDDDSDEDYSEEDSANEDTPSESVAVDVGGNSQPPVVQEGPSTPGVGGNSQAQGQEQPSGSNDDVVRSDEPPVSNNIDTDESVDQVMKSSKEEHFMSTSKDSGESVKPARVGSNQPPSFAAKLASKAKSKGRKSRQLKASHLAGRTTSPRSPSTKRANSNSPSGNKSTKLPKQSNVTNLQVCTNVIKSGKENDNVS